MTTALQTQPGIESAVPAPVRRILSWYASEPPGVRAHLTRVLMQGTLGGTGKVLAFPVDQRVEHGPARTFAPNPPAYDPRYHCRLALKGGCSFYTSHLGSVSVCADEFAGVLPIVLKANGANLLQSLRPDPAPALMGSVDDALRLGCVGVGFTINPGSARSNRTFGKLRELVAEARSRGLFVVCWSYNRGSGIPEEEMEDAVDAVAYAAALAAELGAHIIKVKAPKAAIGLKGNEKIYERVSFTSLTERIRHVMESALAGQRIVLFSGGPAKERDAVLQEVGDIAAGGATGSIMGRNISQRPEAEALTLLGEVAAIWRRHAGEQNQVPQ